MPHRGGPRGRPWHPPHELRDAGPDPADAAQGAPRRATAGGRKRAATIGQRLVRARPTNADRRPRPTPRGDSPTTGLVPPIINIMNYGTGRDGTARDHTLDPPVRDRPLYTRAFLRLAAAASLDQGSSSNSQRHPHWSPPDHPRRHLAAAAQPRPTPENGERENAGLRMQVGAATGGTPVPDCPRQYACHGPAPWRPRQAMGAECRPFWSALAGALSTVRGSTRW